LESADNKGNEAGVTVNSGGLTVCALAAPPPIDGNDIVAETSAEKRTISLDAKRRPLQARVGPYYCLVFILPLETSFCMLASFDNLLFTPCT
jgi:hypothetical protein